MGLNNSPVPFNVAAKGTGDAVAADGTLFNATAYNPALLANAPHFGEFTFGLSLSNDIFTMANYLTNTSNINNLQNAFQNLNNSMSNINQGLQQTPNANVTLVNQGITGFQAAVSNLQTAAATLTNRSIQLGVGLNVAVKLDDHWGFQVYNNSHGVLQVNRGNLVNDIVNLAPLPTLQGSGSVTDVYNAANAFYVEMKKVLDTALPAQSVTLGNAVSTLGANLGSPAAVSLFNNTISNIASSIDQTTLQKTLLNNVADVTALVYIDTVGMVTYSFNPLEAEIPLTVGANFKVVNRRIGYANSSWLSQQDLTNSSNITDQIKNDINQSTFRWGLDLGALYEFEEIKLTVGASVEDIIHSSGNINAAVGDPLYGIVTDPGPTVIRIGASWHPLHQVSLNADVDDLFSSSSTYQGLDLFSHAKIGASYNLGILQLRGGFSNNNLAGGFGIAFLGLDYAYAVDDLTQSYNHYISFKATF